MKKLDIVKVTNKAKYSGQDMKWTEKITHYEKYEKGHIFYHFSNTKLNNFLPKITCFFNINIQTPGYCYAYILENDVELPVYSNEVRINLTEDDNLVFLGEVIHERNYNKKVEEFDSCGRSQGWGPETIIKDNRAKIL